MGLGDHALLGEVLNSLGAEPGPVPWAQRSALVLLLSRHELAILHHAWECAQDVGLLWDPTQEHQEREQERKGKGGKTGRRRSCELVSSWQLLKDPDLQLLGKKPHGSLGSVPLRDLEVLQTLSP